MIAHDAAPVEQAADSQRGHRVGNLDVVRAVAALSVVYAHASLIYLGVNSAIVSLFAQNCWTGIYLFFALSGYLISGPFIRALVEGRELPHTSAYLLRRAWRILPAYWVAFAALLLLVQPFDTSRGGVVVHLLLVHNSFPGQGHAIYSVAWTLGIEMLFYVAVPVGAMLLARRRRAWSINALVGVVVAIWVLSAALRTVFDIMAVSVPEGVADSLLQNLPPMLLFFAPGVIVACGEAGMPSGKAPGWYVWLRCRSHLLLASALTLWLVEAELVPPGGVLSAEVHANVLALASGLAVIGALTAGDRVSRCLAFLRPVGVISYSIYLWHWVVGMVLARHGVFVDSQSLGALLLVGITLPVAALSYRFVEAPGMALGGRWGRGLGRRSPHPHQNAAAMIT